MNLSEDVIRDLLPAYYSGEASDDTRQLVDAYFAEHPGFEAGLAGQRAIQAALGAIAPDVPDERVALRRAKRVLRWQQVMLLVASTLSLNVITLSFSFEIGHGPPRVHWLSVPGQGPFVAILGAASLVCWFAYFRIGKRIRRRILG
jgi:anti-sigma factor RsiW